MFQKLSLISLLFIILISCTTSNHSKNLIVKGTVKGLRLGTLKIGKLKNDTLVTIDSINIDGNEKFHFATHINQPQALVLSLPQVKNGHLVFFAAPNDTIHIFTYVENFGAQAIVNGGANQTAKNEYDKMMRQFSNKELDLFKAKFEATRQHLLHEADSLGKKLERLKQKRKLYTLNFIFRNKDKEIAPYIAMMQFYNNPKILDTIYKTLPTQIQQSVYAQKIKTLMANQN